MWRLIFLCLTCICYVDSISTPSFITKCTWEDAKCFKESTSKAIPEFVKGIPDVNVETLEPMKLRKVNASKPGLDIIITDIVLTGLKNCKTVDVTHSTKNKHLFFQVECTVHAVGKYNMNGVMFLVPVKGNGDLIADINQIVFTINVDYDIVEKTGNKYIKIRTWNYKYELNNINKSKVVFENLFPDNEVLRTSVSTLIEGSGNEVIEDMGSPIIEAVIEKILKNVGKFFDGYPIKYLIQE